MGNRGKCKECGELRVLDDDDCCDCCGEGLTGEQAGLILPMDDVPLANNNDQDDWESDQSVNGDDDMPYM